MAMPSSTGFCISAGLHGVEGEARLDQVFAAIDQAHLGFGDFHAGLFRARQHGLGMLQRGVEAVQPAGHLRGGAGGRGAGIVAAGTDGLRPGEHGSRRIVDGMVGVADHAAAAAARAGEDGVVNALLVELLKQHVAASADGGHGFHLRRLGAVVAVTGGATGSGEIAALGERLPVDAGLVFLELIGGDLVGRHLLRVGVAVRAGLGDAQRMDRRRGYP